MSILKVEAKAKVEKSSPRKSLPTSLFKREEPNFLSQRGDFFNPPLEKGGQGGILYLTSALASTSI